MRCEAVHCFDRATVQFFVYPDGPDGPRVLAEISEDALRDVFGVRGGPESLVQACEAHYLLLEEAVTRRFREHPGKPILLSWADVSMHRG